MLTTDELTGAIPDFNWKEGHSGEILNDTQSAKLEEVWADYIERTHAISSEEVVEGCVNNSADQYVQSFAKMDEAMTDVMKYTGQTKREVEEMNETFSRKLLQERSCPKLSLLSLKIYERSLLPRNRPLGP